MDDNIRDTIEFLIRRYRLHERAPVLLDPLLDRFTVRRYNFTAETLGFAVVRPREIHIGINGNLRFEVVQQVNRPNHFTVVEIWKDAKAVETHSMAAPTREFRDKLATMTGALYDERMYRAID